MGERHCAILGEQEKGQRLTYEDRPAEDDGVEAGKLRAHRFDQQEGALRRARNEARLSEKKPAGVCRREAVHVLRRIDLADDAVRIDMRRQGHLDENAVDGVVGVEAAHQRERLRLAR